MDAAEKEVDTLEAFTGKSFQELKTNEQKLFCTGAGSGLRGASRRPSKHPWHRSAG